MKDLFVEHITSTKYLKIFNSNILSFQITVNKESDGTVRSELTLARVGWKDEGTYTCMAREVSNNEEKSDTPTKQEVLLEVYGMNVSEL